MRAALFGFFAAFLLVSQIASAQTAAPNAPASSAPAPGDVGAWRISQIFTAEQVSPDWFTPAFLKKVPTSQLDGIVKSLRFGLGPYQSVTRSTEPNEKQFPPSWGRYFVSFKDGTNDVYIHLDEYSKINGLWIKTPFSQF